MSTVPVYTLAGEKAGEIELAADVFGLESNQALVHQAVVTTLANQRQGSADTKTRGEVQHTTHKVYRQKGTGRARQGMRSAPHWKGGGVVFGPHPRDYSLSLPKKMRRKALLSALSVKANTDAIFVVNAMAFDRPATKQAVSLLQALELTEKKVLVVVEDLNEPVFLSFRNLQNVMVSLPEHLGTYDVLSANCLLFTQAALERLQTLKQQPYGVAYWVAKQEQGDAE